MRASRLRLGGVGVRPTVRFSQSIAATVFDLGVTSGQEPLPAEFPRRVAHRWAS